MALVRCSACGDITESREMNSCGSCGAIICPGCGAGNHGLCNFCYSDLRYFS